MSCDNWWYIKKGITFNLGIGGIMDRPFKIRHLFNLPWKASTIQRHVVHNLESLMSTVLCCFSLCFTKAGIQVSYPNWWRSPITYLKDWATISVQFSPSQVISTLLFSRIAAAIVASFNTPWNRPNISAMYVSGLNNQHELWVMLFLLFTVSWSIDFVRTAYSNEKISPIPNKSCLIFKKFLNIRKTHSISDF